MADLVALRIVYRPHDEVPYADPVERRTIARHLDRLLRRCAVAEVEPGRYVALPR